LDEKADVQIQDCRAGELNQAAAVPAFALAVGQTTFGQFSVFSKAVFFLNDDQFLCKLRCLFGSLTTRKKALVFPITRNGKNFYGNNCC
jgi:hypothetical protein